MRRSITTAAIAIALLGCGPSAPVSITPTGTATAPSVGPSPSASASPAPAVSKRFEFQPDSVVDTALLGTNDSYVNPGALIEADGVLHLFPNSFSTWPGRMRIPHLTSTDGIKWTLDPEAQALDTAIDGLFPMANPGIDVSTGWVTDDGTWVLLFENVAAATAGAPAPWRIYRMTAPSPQGPWAVEDQPLIDIGADGAFDDSGVSWPSAVRIGDRWAVFYAGLAEPRRGTGTIGVAFSEDGVTWTKHPDPVLVPTERWEFGSLDRPRVVATPDGLVMAYTGLDLNQRALATSTDGVTWTKVPGPSIVQDDFPIQGGSWDAAIRHADGELQYFLEIGSQTTAVYRALLAWP
jgi:sucrose-6-phosphate hydrolase SacC (GH32 family)